MKRHNNILENAESYIESNGLDISPEQLFIEFMFIVKCHEEFDCYLKESKLIFKLNKMKRDERLKKKRELFNKWYFSKYKNKFTKELLIELSEMTFVSERTVQLDVFRETTA